MALISKAMRSIFFISGESEAKPTNRGVLILYAIDDHRARIEGGYGLEPNALAVQRASAIS